jgi:hypothetical protein
MSNDTKKAAMGSSSRRTRNQRHDGASANGSSTNGAGPSIEELIRLRAYELYLQRGAQPNDDLADWLRAERELLGASDAEMPEAEAN